MKVKLTYFKAHGGGPGNLGGKYYSEGEYETTKDHVWAIVEEVDAMVSERRLPGLVCGHSDYHVLILTEPDTVPHLLPCRSSVNPKAQV